MMNRYFFEKMHHIFDMRWNDDGKPFLQVVNFSGLSQIFLEKEQPFFITLKKNDVECVGYQKNGVYVPCPVHAHGTKKCESCKKAEDYFPCQFCNGFNCSRFRDDKIENCDADHMVYLAFFTPELVKVGVSRLSRQKARQFEQGSHATRIFATGISGVFARRMEATLTKVGFPDKVPATQKKDILFPNVSDEKIRKILAEKIEEGKNAIVSFLPEMLKNICTEEIFWDMQSFYAENFSALEKSQKPVHFLSLEENESVGGILKAVKGSFLVIETDNELVTILGKNLVGKKISLEKCEMGITKNGGFQGAFF